MVDTPENDLPGSFWTADVEEAAARLAAILDEERADVLTCYDEIGGYGHPDHIQVHRVGLRAAELAGTPKVFQSTINRDRAHPTDGERSRADARGRSRCPTSSRHPTSACPRRSSPARSTSAPTSPRKRDAMRAHASQIGEKHFMLTMPDDAFEEAFGTEWFIRDGQGPGITETELL